MDKTDIKEVNKKIRSLIFHLGALHGSYPGILEDPEYARAHLVILRQILPSMVHVLKFAADMVPLANRMPGMAAQSTSDLGDASKKLQNINHTAEMAVAEILEILDGVEKQLEEIRQAADAGREIGDLVDQASLQLTTIMSSLQFQDITSQQIEATKALLANLGQGMQALVERLGTPMEAPEIEVKEGSFDSHARYDRKRAQARQAEIDRIVEGEEEKEAAEAQERAATPEDNGADAARSTAGDSLLEET